MPVQPRSRLFLPPRLSLGSRPSTFVLTSPGTLRLYSTAELLTLPPPTWLIDGIMPEGGLVALYGPPESFKSFVALDLALCVATGTPWHGHAVQRGLVLYVAAEGGPGIGKRVRAWLQHHAIDASEAKVAWLVESLTVYKQSDDVDVLMRRLDDELEWEPRFIVIDTLARCFEGDEVKTEDMSRFVAGLDRMRQQYHATVMAIHHTRVGEDRERGNTALRGGLDTMISITRDKKSNNFTLECSKQKDTEHFPEMGFVMEPVPEANSCIVLSTDSQKAENAQQSLTILANGPLTWDDWHSSTDLSKTTFYRAFVELKKTGQILKEKGQWRVKRSK
jgi:hypothetical protein